MIISKIKSDSFVKTYFDFCSTYLDESKIKLVENKVNDMVNLNSILKMNVTEIIEIILSSKDECEDVFNDERSLDLIIKRCNLIIENCNNRDGFDKTISDEYVIEMVSDIVYDIINDKPLKSGNFELSLILSAIILRAINRPYFSLNVTDKNKFYNAVKNKFSLRVFFSDKYKKLFINDNGHILEATQIFENASKFEDESGIILVEWHALNQAINKWKNELI